MSLNTAPPLLVIDPSCILPPELYCHGVSLAHAASSRPLLKQTASPIVATAAEAVSGPTPGMLIRRCASSS